MGVLSRLGKKLRVVGAGSSNKPIKPSYHSATLPRYTEPEEEPQSPRGDQDVTEYIQGLLSEHRVVLFMKGSALSPKCGFSATAAGILSSHGVPFHTVDILADADVRQGVKDFSNWPTIPQTYIDGEFVGGSDILGQLHESGELAELLAAKSEG